MIQLRCASPFQTGTSRTAFWISHNVGTVHLHEIRLYKKSGFAGTGTTDYKYVFISRILRLFWSARHHKPFRRS